MEMLWLPFLIFPIPLREESWNHGWYTPKNKLNKFFLIIINILFNLLFILLFYLLIYFDILVIYFGYNIIKLYKIISKILFQKKKKKKKKKINK